MGLDKPEAVNKINLLTYLLRLKLMEIHSYLQPLLLQPENIVYGKSEINQYLSLDIYLDIIMDMFPFRLFWTIHDLANSELDIVAFSNPAVA